MTGDVSWERKPPCEESLSFLKDVEKKKNYYTVMFLLCTNQTTYAKSAYNRFSHEPTAVLLMSAVYILGEDPGLMVPALLLVP